MKTLNFVFTAYQQLENCPIEDLEEVFENTQREIKSSHPDVYKRIEGIMDITKKAVINVRKKEALN